MLKEFLKNPRALLYAVSVHVVLLLLLVMSLKWNIKPAPLQGSGDIVHAVVIDEARLQAEKERKREEAQRQRDAAEAARRAEERQRQAALDKQRAEEQRKREAQAAALKAKQQAAEQLRLAKLKAEKEASDRKLAEQQAQRKQEEQRRKAAEAQRKAEELRKADEARNLEMMRQQMAQEEAERAAQAKAEQRRLELASMQSRYVAMLQNLVNRNWIRPPTARAGMSCTVHVRLIPDGEVTDARVVRGSGDPAFDRSAATAVLKSSPLPPPPDPALFQREFDFVFKPEG